MAKSYLGLEQAFHPWSLQLSRRLFSHQFSNLEGIAIRTRRSPRVSAWSDFKKRQMVKGTCFAKYRDQTQCMEKKGTSSGQTSVRLVHKIWPPCKLLPSIATKPHVRRGSPMSGPLPQDLSRSRLTTTPGRAVTCVQNFGERIHGP